MLHTYGAWISSFARSRQTMEVHLNRISRLIDTYFRDRYLFAAIPTVARKPQHLVQLHHDAPGAPGAEWVSQRAAHDGLDVSDFCRTWERNSVRRRDGTGDSKHQGHRPVVTFCRNSSSRCRVRRTFCSGQASRCEPEGKPALRPAASGSAMVLKAGVGNSTSPEALP